MTILIFMVVKISRIAIRKENVLAYFIILCRSWSGWLGSTLSININVSNTISSHVISTGMGKY